MKFFLKKDGINQIKNLFLVIEICTFFLLHQTILAAQSTNKKTSHSIFENEQKYYSLIWSDEFNYDGEIDTNKWFHQTQIPNGISWFNNEIQHYTNRNKKTLMYQMALLKLLHKKRIILIKEYLRTIHPLG